MFRKDWNGFKEVSTQEEADKIIDGKNVFYDNGVDQILIARTDMALAVANTPLSVNASIIDGEVDAEKGEITTSGNFLMNCHVPEQMEIIHEVQRLQTEVEIEDAPCVLFISEYSEFWDEDRIMGW